MKVDLAKDQTRLLNRVTIIPLVLICLLASLLTFSQNRISQVDHLVDETDEAIKKIRYTQVLLLLMESNYNSYVVTRREEFLTQYYLARNVLPENFSQLEKIVSESGGENQFLDLYQALTDWINHSESLFGQKINDGVKTFESKEFQTIGNMFLNRLRNAFEDFINKQVALRNKQLNRAKKTREQFLLYGLGLLIFVAIFLAWYFRKQLYGAFMRYELQARLLKESREDLKHSLSARDSALKSRDEFITIASHELNTPLQSLKLQVQMLQREVNRLSGSPEYSEKVLRFLQGGNQQVNRLSQLIQDMLEITKMGNGNMELSTGLVNLNDLIQKTVVNIRPLIKSTGSRLDVEIPQEINGKWDGARIEQVIQNLLSNALKYGKGNPVSLSAHLINGVVKIEIKDEGLGVDEDFQKRIFKRFERNISASEVSGLGLGLFISKQTIEAHGGMIQVESAGENLGSTFTVTLPLVAVTKEFFESDVNETLDTMNFSNNYLNHLERE